jgi:hypothetical protein
MHNASRVGSTPVFRRLLTIELKKLFIFTLRLLGWDQIHEYHKQNHNNLSSVSDVILSVLA